MQKNAADSFASKEMATTLAPVRTRPAVERRYQRVAGALGLVAGATGFCVLVGWTFHLLPLMTVLPGLVTMKPNTALCVGCGGLSLFLLTLPKSSPRSVRLSDGLAAGMVLIGGLSLVEYLTGYRLGIDELLFKDPFVSAAPGRIAPLTSINSIGIGCALVLLRFPRRIVLAHTLAMCVAFNSILATVGYLYGASAFYESGRFTAVALHTSFAFLLLCAGVWCARSQAGFMRVATAPATSGMLVRRYGLAALVFPFVIGWLRVQGVRLGWYSSEVGVVLVAMTNATIFLTLVWVGALSVRTAEHRQTAAQQDLRESEEKYRSLFTSIDTGFCVVEMVWDALGRPADYRFVQVNPAFEGHTGLRDAVGKTIREMHPEFEQVWLDRYGHVARTGEPARFIEGSDVLGRWFDVYASATGSTEDRQVAVLFSDISERRRSELALQSAKAEAEAALRAKDDFLAALSHELRTPLTPVLMAASDLSNDPAMPADARETLRMMQRNIGLEARLIDDLLDLTRIAKGKLEMRAQDCEVHSLLGLALEIVRDEAQAKGVDLGVDLAAMRTHFTGDPARMQQVFWNLLKNAVKFTPPGGQVSIHSHDEGNRLVIEVSDTGRGLSPDHLERIFVPFEQAGLVNNAQFGGLGLGLTIAKAIVEMHGGTIQATSAGPGLGATFRVELAARERPLGIVHPAGPDAAPPPRDRETIPQAGPLRLLLVEDHEATREVLCRLLSRAGYQVTTASSVASARETAERADFDLVVSDVGLPDGTGIELMEVLHARYGLRGIALTGYGMEEDQRRTREVGFVEHLVKPVDFAQLRRAIDRTTAPAA